MSVPTGQCDEYGVYRVPRQSVDRYGVLTRKQIWANRYEDILEAIEARRRAKYKIPAEWFTELIEITAFLENDD